MGKEPNRWLDGWPVAALVLTLLSASLLGRALVGADAFFMRDVLHYYWPTREAVREAIRHGLVPQWNYTSHAGLPLLGDIHAAVLYFPNLLFQVLSYPRAYAWLIFVHQVLGSLGVTLLLRRLGLRSGAALLGGTVFELSGYVVGLTNAGPLMAGTAYVPWAAWTLKGPLPIWKKSLALAVLLALQSLTGDPQSVLFSLLVCTVFVLWGEERAKNALALLAGTILSGLLAAVQLLPAWRLLRESTRAVAQSGFAEEWSLHPVRLLELAFAFPFGGYLEQPQFWAWFTVKGPGTIPFALSVYLGVSALILAMIGLKRDRTTGVGVALLILGVLLALGTHGPFGFVLEHIPPFQFFRYPEKYVLLSTLGIAVLSAAGASRVFDREVSRVRIAIIGAFVLGFGGLILLAVLARSQALLLFGRMLEYSGTRGSPSGPLDSALSSATRTILFASLLIGAAILSFSRRRDWFRPLIAAVVVADLGLAAMRIIWTAPGFLYSVRPPVADEVLAAAPTHPFRIMRDADSLNRRAPGSRSMEGLIARRAWELATLKSNLGGIFGLEELSGYGAVRLARWWMVSQALAREPSKLAGIFNGCMALSSDDHQGLNGSPGFVRVSAWPDLGLALFRAEPCVGRLHTVERVVGVASIDESLRRLQGDWDPNKEALVEGEVSSAFGTATLSDSTFDSQRISAHVTAPAGGAFLVFATAYYPGWRVWVDGVEQQLRVVNGATMGTRIPAGNHHVEFRFRDQMLTTGASVTAVTVLALLAILLKVRLLGRHRLAKLSFQWVFK